MGDKRTQECSSEKGFVHVSPGVMRYPQARRGHSREEMAGTLGTLVPRVYVSGKKRICIVQVDGATGVDGTDDNLCILEEGRAPLLKGVCSSDVTALAR